jgi:hypothetical protein
LFLLFEHIFTEYDNYYDDNYISYPTDDKKYECRIGSFEGFFVSSVEFCKHVKFDKHDRDRDSNKVGPPGPQGPAGRQGPSGATGATGPAGITVLNGTNIYVVIADTGIVTNTGEGVNSTAVCDEGDIAFSASFSVGTPVFSSIGSYDLRFSGPVEVVPGEKWETFIVGEAGTSVRTIALCFDNPPAHIP